MSTYHVAALILVLAGSTAAQVPAKVDFRREVQPIFKEYCIGCHGPSQQMNGFRLDRRRDAMRGGTIAVIGPGNGAASRLYLRLIGNRYGTQMPLTGSLTTDQIDVVKRWIDEGAEWPDDLSGDTPAISADPQANQVMQALRNGDRATFRKILRENPNIGNLKGRAGSTPLMYAALYGDAESVRELLERGANPNISNDAGATALMWAVDDLAKTRLLVAHGADANARSGDNRTPLLIASGWYGAGPIVKLLLDRGADPSVEGARRFTPLAEAAYVGDEAVLQMLIERGADLKKGAPLALTQSLMLNCPRCAGILIGSADQKTLDNALLTIAPPRAGNAGALKMLLDRGADANAKGAEGQTILMSAASSDTLPVGTIQMLVGRGADLNAKTASGATALTFAELHQASVADLLIKAGAQKLSAVPKSAPVPKPAGSVREAFERSMPLLQRADISFLEKSGCVSCHNNALAGMTIGAARKQGLPINESMVQQQIQRIGSYLEDWRERALQGMAIPGDADTISYLLIGLAAENYPPDESTDALARYLRSKQSPDGRWKARDHRPPLSTSDIDVTVRSMRAIQAYAPKPQRREYEKSIRLAAQWLTTAEPHTTEDRAYHLLGLAWGPALDGNKDVIRKAARALLAEQRSGGGWAQMPSLASDAYATGEALVALKACGALAVTDAAYKSGLQFLLNTQLEDGSWYVTSRALPIMPYFDSDFPHGTDQFISAAATNWAAMALAPATGSNGRK